jgi:hypothetical protein
MYNILSFKHFISESVRVGLPHLYSTKTEKGNETPSLSTDQFEKSTKGGKLHINNVTEKTDGQTFKFGHDEQGFYSQHSGSGDEKIRTGQGHIDRAKKRAAETGREYSPEAPTAFAKFHDALHGNKALQEHLKQQYQKTGKEVVVKGEAFNLNLAKPAEKPGEVKFVHTPYSTKGMGKHGSFIIHSKLPENQGHDIEHIKSLSDKNVKLDDDKIEHKPGHVDVKDEVNDFKQLNHELINSRTTPKNKTAKLAEQEKFNTIKKRVSDKVTAHIGKLGIKNKFGSGTEGLVVHPSSANPEATRFKAINPAFKEAKAAGGRFGANK